MSHRDHDSHIGRDLALFGGAALLFWLLLRGKSWGFGPSGEVELSGTGAGTQVTPTSSEATAACRVWIRADHIDLDGTLADLPTVVARCGASGRAEVHATGGAIVRTIGDVVHALQTAGVVVSAPPDVWRSAWAGNAHIRTP